MMPVTDASKSGQPAASDLLLLVDAGGTKTAAWLIDASLPEHQCVLGRGRSSAGNPLSVGFAAAARAVAEAASQAKHAAGRSTAAVPRAILSIAGSANHKLRDQFLLSLHEIGLSNRVAIVSDVVPVLAAGSATCCGVALIAGTGSVAFARTADGRTTMCGGWGYLLGDEGSGYAIGRAALQSALRELEAGDSPSPLAAAILSELGAKSVLDVTKAIYRHVDPRAAIASHAHLVIEAAEKDDPTAQAILDVAATELAKLVTRTMRTIGSTESSIQLAVAGGVLVGSRRIREQLEIELRNRGLVAQLAVIDEPLAGCIRLASPALSGAMLEWHALD